MKTLIVIASKLCLEIKYISSKKTFNLKLDNMKSIINM